VLQAAVPVGLAVLGMTVGGRRTLRGGLTRQQARRGARTEDRRKGRERSAAGDRCHTK